MIGRSPWKKQRLRADSLDSCSEEEEDGEEGTRKDSLFSSDKEEERPVRFVHVAEGNGRGGKYTCICYVLIGQREFEECTCKNAHAR